LSQRTNRGAVPRSTTLYDQAVQHRYGGVGIDAALDDDGQRLAGVLVDDVERLEDPPIGGLVELVVQRPHVIGMGGRQPLGWCGGGAQPPAFAAPCRHSQALLAPQPLDGLAVHMPALLAQLSVSAPVPPPGVDAAEPAQLLAQHPIPVGLQGLVALRTSMLTDQLTRPSL
jgi:hypothetical protein